MKKTIFIIVGLALLAFAYYAVSPLFITVKVDESAPVQSQGQDISSAATTSVVASTPAVAPAPAPVPAPANVIGTAGHPASGTVRLVQADTATYVRYENFKTINGPDLYVYLAKDLDAKEFVNLGRIRATEGNVNYEIPAGVNAADYPYVLIWCKAFGVLFNSAKLF